jgi:hypothetical protein
MQRQEELDSFAKVALPSAIAMFAAEWGGKVTTATFNKMVAKYCYDLAEVMREEGAAR